MCRIASLFFLQSLIGSMSTDGCDFNNFGTQEVIKYLSSKARHKKENHAIQKEILGEHAP